jgi:hypothetical protein
VVRPLVIACVKWGGMYHACYANILYDMVKRNLPQGCPFTFLCFTDDPAGLAEGIGARTLPNGLDGWWNKLALFKTGTFAEGTRVLYFDLDTLIVGPLDALAACDEDFTILRDFYRPDGYGSGVMLWRSGACDGIWDSYEAAGRPKLAGGDQIWLERARPHAAMLQDILPDCVVSFKEDCMPLPPQGASVVAFHGEPKQDNCAEPWVEEIWRIGGPKGMGSNLLTRQASDAQRSRYAQSLGFPWLLPQPAHPRVALIAANGASLAQTLRTTEKDGMDIFAVGGASKALQDMDIPFHAHVLRQGGGEDLPQGAFARYYAATCASDLWHAVQGNVTLWNPAQGEFRELSTGLCTLRIAFLLGYRTLHLVGFDGCYLDGKRRRDEERLSTIVMDGTAFTVAPWQLTQARQFALLADALVTEKCILHVYGIGLIPTVSTQLIGKED